MIYMEEEKQIIFIGSPRLSSLNELMECNVYLSDIPLYDVTRELVLLNQQRIAEIEVRYFQFVQYMYVCSYNLGHTSAVLFWKSTTKNTFIKQQISK